MGKAVGIDLGAANSAIAVWEDGRLTIIPNVQGHVTTPSVVAFTQDGRVLVGEPALRQAVLNPSGTVRSPKRFMGRAWGDVERTKMQESSPVLLQGPGDSVRFSIHGKVLAPEVLSALLLQTLVADASNFLGERVEEAVITVPASFSDAQRQATLDAGKIAGLKELRLINEPTAAALAYAMESGRTQTVLVFHLGGGSLDVSVLDVAEGVCEVRSTSGDAGLGGVDFHRRLMEWVAEDFLRETGVEIRHDPQACQRLFEAVEQAKRELSSARETEIHLPFLAGGTKGGGHLHRRVRRSLLEELTQDLLASCRNHVEEALALARLAPEDLDEVMLVGGAARMPAVQDVVRSLTGGRQTSRSVQSDEIVVAGAALQAAVLHKRVPEVIVLDVVSHTVGMEIQGGSMKRLIERNSTLPARREELFTLEAGPSGRVDVVLLQGEHERAEANRLLGSFRLESACSQAEGPGQFIVTFDVDTDGILSVKGREGVSDEERPVTLLKASNLSGAEVERLAQQFRHDHQAL